MNDRFLRELRKEPPLMFKARLKSRLDRQATRGRSWAITAVLTTVLLGTAFAYFQVHSTRQSTQVRTSPQLTHATTSRTQSSQLQQEQDVVTPRLPVEAPAGVPTEARATQLVPRHWHLAYLRGLPVVVADYLYSVDSKVAWNGSSSAYLRVSDARGLDLAPFDTAYAACIIQGSQAVSFRGKRMQLVAHVKTGAESRVGLTFWVFDARENAFGVNTGMARREQWSELSLVLTFPADATRMLYGGCLPQQGSMWLDSVSLQEVDSSVALSGDPVVIPPNGPGSISAIIRDGLLREPSNLDFEDTTPWTPEFLWEVKRQMPASFIEH